VQTRQWFKVWGAVAVLAASLAGCSQKAKDDAIESLNPGNKVEPALQAAVDADVQMVAAAVTSHYVTAEADAKVMNSGGVYYVCGTDDTDCASDVNMVAPASPGVQLVLARTGAASWCVQGGTQDRDYQVHLSAAVRTLEAGPC
jgi:hypothetical protein